MKTTISFKFWKFRFSSLGEKSSNSYTQKKKSRFFLFKWKNVFDSGNPIFCNIDIQHRFSRNDLDERKKYVLLKRHRLTRMCVNIN